MAIIHVISNPVKSTVPVFAEILKTASFYHTPLSFGSITLS